MKVGSVCLLVVCVHEDTEEWWREEEEKEGKEEKEEVAVVLAEARKRQPTFHPPPTKAVQEKSKEILAKNCSFLVCGLPVVRCRFSLSFSRKCFALICGGIKPEQQASICD